jgi:hypothetical protein
MRSLPLRATLSSIWFDEGRWCNVKREKTFDCVQMKNAIQARHLQERRGLTDAEVRRRIAERLASSDDPVAQKWCALGQRQNAPA